MKKLILILSLTLLTSCELFEVNCNCFQVVRVEERALGYDAIVTGRYLCDNRQVRFIGNPYYYQIDRQYCE